MDIDLKLIEGVRQCPILYNNDFSLEERNHAWLQLAEKLKTHEQLLKIRWHYLLQRYQREINFRYSKKMNFLQRHANTHHGESEHWPEFIITEEDLKDERPEEKEEFRYLLDENEDKNECKISNEKEFGIKDTKKQSNTKPLENNSIDSAAKDQVDNEKADNICLAQMSRSSEDHDLTKEVTDTIKNYNDNTNITNKIAIINMDKDVLKSTEKESTNQDSKQENTTKLIVAEAAEATSNTSKEKIEQPRNERCEDVIFGELVTAMLMRMDESKKKNIKKEIMNMLLS
ncbi:hypothetical protein DOY81_000211 [Sarcophaga bullata]|nr:hypothetical protein DOY81_000211 [Sarcophaga bullata]